MLNVSTHLTHQIIFSGACAHLLYRTQVGLTSQRFKHVHSARFSDDLGPFKFITIAARAMNKSALKRTQLRLNIVILACNQQLNQV